jgi:hypothetical protein
VKFNCRPDRLKLYVLARASVKRLLRPSCPIYQFRKAPMGWKGWKSRNLPGQLLDECQVRPGSCNDQYYDLPQTSDCTLVSTDLKAQIEPKKGKIYGQHPVSVEVERFLLLTFI